MKKFREGDPVIDSNSSDVLAELDGSIRLARRYLKSVGIADKKLSELKSKLDVPSYQASVVAWLHARNIPALGIAPNASANPAYKVSELPALGAAVILLRAPKLRKCIDDAARQPVQSAPGAQSPYVHIGEACRIAKEVALLLYPRLAINSIWNQGGLKTGNKAAGNWRTDQANRRLKEVKKIYDEYVRTRSTTDLNPSRVARRLIDIELYHVPKGQKDPVGNLAKLIRKIQKQED